MNGILQYNKRQVKLETCYEKKLFHNVRISCLFFFAQIVKRLETDTNKLKFQNPWVNPKFVSTYLALHSTTTLHCLSHSNTIVQTQEQYILKNMHAFSSSSKKA